MGNELMIAEFIDLHIFKNEKNPFINWVSQFVHFSMVSDEPHGRLGALNWKHAVLEDLVRV